MYAASIKHPVAGRVSVVPQQRWERQRERERRRETDRERERVRGVSERCWTD